MRTLKLSVAAVAAAAGLAMPAASVFAQTINWASAVDGNWSDSANWNPANVPDNGSEQPTLGFNTPYTVTFNLIVNVGALTITNSKANLDIAPGAYLLPLADITNNGTIRINPTKSGNDAHLRFDANAGLNGSGSVVLFCDQSDLNDAQLAANGTTITQGASHSIRGTGNVIATLINNGTVRADSPGEVLLLSSTPKTNNKLFTASGGGILSMSGIGVTQGANGVIRAQNGSTVSFTTATVEGGKIDATGTGRATVDGITTFSSVTNSAPVDINPGAYILVQGTGLTNNAVITVNPTESGNDAHLRFDSSGDLAGTGEVLLKASVNDLNDAQLAANGTTITQGADHLVHGTGNITGTLVNNGTVLADRSGRTLLVSGGAKTNNSLMAATGGGTLSINGIALTQGQDGVVDAQDASQVSLDSMTLAGGLLTTEDSGLVGVNNVTTFNNVTSTGAVYVNPGSYILVTGSGLTNNGVITVNPTESGNDAHLRFDQDGALGGTGEVLLMASVNDLNDAVLWANGTTMTQGADHLVHGTGNITGAMVNNGTVLADRSGRTLLLSGSVKTNNSLMASIGGGTLSFDSTTLTQGQGGVVKAGDASLVAFTNVTFSGGLLTTEGSGVVGANGISSFSSATTTGMLQLNPGSYILSQGDLTNEGTIVINPDKSGNDAHLRFDQNGALLGAGEVVLRASDDVGDAQLYGNGVSVTIGADQTVRGRGILNGAPLTNLGTFSPGESSTDLFYVSGNITLGDSSVFHAEFGGLGDGQFDSMTVTSTATLGGALNVSLVNGFVPDTCAVFPVVTAGSIQGAFDSVSGDAGKGRVFRVAYTNTQAKVYVTCYADMAVDCKLDLFDFLAFTNYFNAGDPIADCTGDGTLDLFDFLCFVNAFNKGC